jgi:2-polyprenyl-3-methyl-5-hydroxy-6-metoxy-1,4-benzoquinol methylase
MSAYDIGRPETSWWMPQMEDRGDVILLDGTIRPGAWPPPEPLRIAVDGKLFTNADYLDVPGRDAISFRGMLPVKASFGDKTEVVLRLVGETSGAHAREWDQFHLLRPGVPSDVPLPPSKLTNRAIWMGPRTFDKWGYALKRKYDEAVSLYTTKPREEQRLLDWGCGSGRMAKYLARECAYTGIDIDREAIEWCRANIKNANFELQGLEARTKFADASFDAVIGISIFTHLREEEQFAWLKELSRVVRPDGVVAVSVNCATSLRNAGNPRAVVERLKSHGFCDTGVESMLKGVTADDEYYRNIYHTHGYIRETWSHEFEILDILPGFVANMQDMVFLRPRT